MDLMPNIWGDRPVATDMNCPISGQPLWEIPNRWDVLDGPTLYMTSDKKYVYEKWPRSWGEFYLVKEDGQEPFIPFTYLKERFYVQCENKTWKGYYTTYQHNTSIPMDYPWEYLYAYAKSLYKQYVVEERLREIRHEKWLKEHKKGSGFEGVVFPIVRRIYSSSLANDLVSIQPLEAPKGQIFYLDYKYKSKKKLPKWLWGVVDKMNTTYDGGPLAQRGTVTREHKLFGITIWKTKGNWMS